MKLHRPCLFKTSPGLGMSPHKSFGDPVYGWAEAKVANFRSIGLGDASTKKVRCLERYVDFTMNFWPRGKYVW